jgi:hypothetical protein
MMRSIVGARLAAAIGGGGGSMVDSGSRFESKVRIPGRTSRATTMATKGIEGTTAAFQILFGEMYPSSTVVVTPIKTATAAAIGNDRRSAHAAAAIAVTVRIT